MIFALNNRHGVNYNCQSSYQAILGAFIFLTAPEEQHYSFANISLLQSSFVLLMLLLFICRHAVAFCERMVFAIEQYTYQMYHSF
jgi:hypothetical protein